jgi:hypothetical protein
LSAQLADSSFQGYIEGHNTTTLSWPEDREQFDTTE